MKSYLFLVFNAIITVAQTVEICLNSTGSLVFDKECLTLLAGSGVLGVAFILACLAVLLIVILEMKLRGYKKIRQRYQRQHTKDLSLEQTGEGVAGLCVTEEGGGEDRQYENMEGDEGYIKMLQSPVDRYENMEGTEGYMKMLPSPTRLNSSSSLTRKFSLTGQDNRIEVEVMKRDIVDDVFQTPATDENSLYAQCKTLNVKYIMRDSIKIGEKLGSGQFGTVMKGVWTNVNGEEVEVAVKMLKKGSNLIKFLREAAIMGQFNHPNVIRLHGVIIEREAKMLVLELLSGGDLHKSLVEMRPNNAVTTVDADLPHTLLSYCRQVASGMTYLANKGFIHRDLAARNILLSDDGTCKIADFGMARDLIDENYYMAQGGRIPVKWTAPEYNTDLWGERREDQYVYLFNIPKALHYKKFSTASDVWSFGIVMYEIWSLGYQPYDGYNNTKILEMIDRGQRLPPPSGCPRAIYSLMIKCWHSSASNRPSFPTVLQKLSLPDTKILKNDLQQSEGSVHLSLGMDVSYSLDLYKDLQQTYLVCSTV